LIILLGSINGCLIDLLHADSVLLSSLQWWWSILSSFSAVGAIIINAETKLDHTVDPAGVLSWILKVESGAQQRGLEEQVD